MQQRQQYQIQKGVKQYLKVLRVERDYGTGEGNSLE